MAKKSFRESIIKENQINPAEAFITMPATKEEKKPAPAVNVDAKKERKSIRVNLLFKPSVKRNIEKLATMQQTSINDLISVVMEKYIEDNAEAINRYNSTFGEE